MIGLGLGGLTRLSGASGGGNTGVVLTAATPGALPGAVTNGAIYDVTSPAVRVEGVGGAWTMTGGSGGIAAAVATFDALRTMTIDLAAASVAIADGAAVEVASAYLRIWDSVLLTWIHQEARALGTPTLYGRVSNAPTAVGDVTGFTPTVSGTGAITYPSDYVDLDASAADTDTAYLIVATTEDNTHERWISADVYLAASSGSLAAGVSHGIQIGDGAELTDVALRESAATDRIVLLSAASTASTPLADLSCTSTWRHVEVLYLSPSSSTVWVDGVRISVAVNPAIAVAVNRFLLGDAASGASSMRIRCRNVSAGVY